MKNKKYIILLIILMITVFSFNISKTYAGRGCCSWHGGQAYCDTTTGRWVCSDGTYSPSCKCSTEELIDGTTDSNDDNNNVIMTYKEYIKQQEQNDSSSDDNTTFWGNIAVGLLILAYSPLIYEIIKELIIYIKK